MINVLPQFSINLRLYFRNTMALLYGYLFPTIFLVAFWVLYRYEAVPLVRHMGELLTVTALGGACFGLPTAMVSERERGVWRRYRLAPISTAQLVASTVLARYVLLITAALLQIALAMAIGMPLPDHLFDLWLAFTLVAFAFLGLGLVIAMMADTVPAVQALGQSIFLPMLIIGGVAVRLESLPAWAQHLSAFFPGRYAVEAIQVSVDGGGLGAARFSLLALLLIGLAGCLAGAKLFRWDAQERFITRSGKGWIGVALAAWIAVGVGAEWTGHALVTGNDVAARQGMPSDVIAPPLRPDTGAAPEPDTAALEAEPEPSPSTPADTTHTAEAAPSETEAPEAAPSEEADTAAVAPSDDEQPDGEELDGEEPQADAPPESVFDAFSSPAPWQNVTMEDIERDMRFDDLPPDEGVVAPIATANDRISSELAQQLQCVRANLGFWRPGQVTDPVQRTRNYLYVAAVPDMFQFEEFERWVPLAVFDHLRYILPEDQLIKILYWIATHPDEGDVAAASQLSAVCIDTGGPSDEATLRERTSFYARKLLGRMTGEIPTP